MACARLRFYGRDIPNGITKPFTTTEYTQYTEKRHLSHNRGVLADREQNSEHFPSTRISKTPNSSPFSVSDSCLFSVYSAYSVVYLCLLSVYPVV
jgi:hypothetical protein